MNKFLHPFRALKDWRKAKTKAEIFKKSFTVINVMEFEGELFLSYGGEPIMPIKYISNDPDQLTSCICEARDIWRNWAYLQDGL